MPPFVAERCALITSVYYTTGRTCSAQGYSTFVSCWASGELKFVQIFAVGGSDGHNDLSSVEVFDPVALKWSKIAELPLARSNNGEWLVRCCCLSYSHLCCRLYQCRAICVQYRWLEWPVLS